MEESSKLIQVHLLGFQYSNKNERVCSMILEETGGKRRLSIVIGLFEANSIFIGIRNQKMPRPITHDLMLNMATTFGYVLRKVVIYDMQKNVYSANLYFTKLTEKAEHDIEDFAEEESECVVIDARSSDALAMAVRCNCPVFVNEEILDAQNVGVQNGDGVTNGAERNDLTLCSEEELQDLLQEALRKDDFETAIRIREEKKRRSGK